MQAWGQSVRNGALLATAGFSGLAVYLFLAGQMTWLWGIVTVGGGVVAGGVAFAVTRLSAVTELLEESQKTEAEIQRRLVDALAGNARVSMAQLASALEVSPEAAADALRDLSGRGLFAGAVSWEAGVIYPRSVGYLASVGECLHCGAGLPQVRHTGVTCGVCRAVHSDISA